jgi:hypothetical protein
MNLRKNPAYIFVLLAALAQGVMWVNLFSLIHHGILVYVGGIPAGLAIVGIITRTANLLPRVQSKRARNAGWFFLGLVICVEPIVLGVVNWWFMPHELQITFISYIMAGGASLVISLVLVMGALVDRNLIPAEKPATSEDKPAKASKKAKKADEKPAEPETQPALPKFFCSVAGCAGNPKTPDGSFGSQSALNAHGRKHNEKPLAVGLFEQAASKREQK